MQAELPTVQIGVCVRYKVWRSNKDKRLHLLCAEAAEAFEALPAAVVRGMGPWTGGPEGAIDRLRLPFRVMLNQQGFAVMQPQLDPRAVYTARSKEMRNAGHVPQHGGLRQMTCPRCNGRGWIMTPRSRPIIAQQACYGRNVNAGFA